MIIFFYCVGDITEKGYKKKVEKLQQEGTEEIVSPLDAAVSMKNICKEPSIKKELSRLFSSKSFTPSAVGKYERKKARKTATAKSRHVTTVCLVQPVACVRRRDREILAKDGRIKDLKIFEGMNGEDIEDLIKDKFSEFAEERTSITFYKNSKSGLAQADAPSNGKELLELTGHGSLYVHLYSPSDTPSVLPGPSDTPTTLPTPSDTPTTLPTPSDTPITLPTSSDTSISLPTSSDTSISLLTPSDTPITLPTSSDTLTALPVAELLLSEEVVKNQLTDSMVGQLWLEQAGIYDTQEEDLDPVRLFYFDHKFFNACIKLLFFKTQELVEECKKRKEFFLCTRDLEVQRWMKSRTAKGRTIKTTRSFAVVDEELFNDYDEHRLLYRKENPNSRIVPVCDLLLYWMAERELPITQFNENGEKYCILSDSEFDMLALWVEEKRQTQ